MSNYGPGENYQGNNTVRPLRIANSNYSWEENRKTEGAMDLGFLQERIFFSVAKYWNRSNNQLVGYQLPGITGFTSYQTNLPAQVVNTGWEFELRTTNVYKADFSWTTAANISFSRNRLTSFRDLAASSYANAYLIGQSLNIARGYHFTGVDSKTGLAQFEDINGDGVLSNISDFTTIANLDPKYYGGIQNDLKYRDISLGFFWQFVKQEGYTVVNKPGDFSNQSTESLQRWRKPGDRTAIPRAATTPGNAAYDLNANLALSNAAYADASYLRLRNVVLAYNLSPAVLKKLRLQLCRIYLQGQNLFTITGYKGADPETQFAMPPLKVLTSGIQLTL
jgi:hypothetical protein